MTKGCVYLATCEHNGETLVKIGSTADSHPEERMGELYGKFSIEHKLIDYYLSEHYEQIEKDLHEKYEGQLAQIKSTRIDPKNSREHFNISPEDAKDALNTEKAKYE